MGETIQTFVDKIRTEGVQAGQKQADDLLARARKDADEIISQAEQEKQRIIADAEAQGRIALARGRTELELACRDAALRLRDALERALREVLAGVAKEKLTDTTFVSKLLSDIVLQYAQADIGHEQTFQINVPEEMRKKLADWAVAEIARDSAGRAHVGIDLTGSLRQAGFEYNASGATVEVTLESVVAVLSEMVSPRLREIIETAMAEDKAEKGSRDG